MRKRQPSFTSLIDEYIVLKLRLSDYNPTKRVLGDEFTICGPEVRASIRRQERKLLESVFEHWSGPYEGSLKGWREDSPIYVLHKGKLVAGVYLCDENEFDEGEKWGQLHYAFMHSGYRGKGVYSVLFQKAVEKAVEWNLEGLILNSDRHMLHEVYLRWGAIHWKTILKKPQHRRQPFLARVVRRILRR